MNPWFKHDIYTVNDPKIIVLLNEFGGIAYAFFWRIIEMLYASESGDLILDQTLLLSLSVQLKTPTETLKDILTRCFDLNIFTKTVSYDPTNRDKNTLKLDQNFGSKTPKMIQNDPKNDPDHLDQILDHFVQNDPTVFTSKRVKETIHEKSKKWRQFKENQSSYGKKGGRPAGSVNLDQKGYESQEVDLEKNNKDLRSKQLKSNIIKIRSKTHWSNFNFFWKFYPKRVAKLAAYKIWTTKKLDEHLPLILKNLEERKNDDEWKRGFIPNPSNYLNNERWLDEVQYKSPIKKKFTDGIFENNLKILQGDLA